MKLSDFPRHVQERIQRDNPDLFVCAVEARQSKPAAASSLDGAVAQQQGGARGVATIFVSMVAHLLRPMDDDNLVGSLKPLRDAIAESIGLDDGDGGLRWEYGQCKTAGQEGVTVKIQKP